jgi:mRNA interferase RelE/StbE
MFIVKVKKPAEKFLHKIQEDYRNNILTILDELKTNPIPYISHDVKRLEGYTHHFRIRKGKIRIVYEVIFSESKIIVHDIDFRGGIY